MVIQVTCNLLSNCFGDDCFEDAAFLTFGVARSGDVTDDDEDEEAASCAAVTACGANTSALDMARRSVVSTACAQLLTSRSVHGSCVRERKKEM